MSSNRMVIATLLIASLFFISPALACNYPGPSGSSISVTIYASDGKTPLPGATISIQNGSSGCTYVSDTADPNGQFIFTTDQAVSGLTYKVHATYGGDEIHVQGINGLLQCVQHSVDSGTFTLNDHQAKVITLTMPGVTVVHGEDGTPTPCPGQGPTATPIPASGTHAPYPPMGPGMTPGTLYGAVTLHNGTCTANGAYVAIVSSADPSIVYSYTYTDCDGFYQILNVNSTSNAEYKVYAVDNCGDNAYSEPFVVGSGESIRMDMALSDKEACTVTPVPAVTATPTALPADDSITPTPITTDITTDHAADLSVQQNNSGILGQIADFFNSIFSSIF